jgi:uncharacterized protein (DUF427 family)
MLKDRVIAESDDIVAEGGYHYFPISVVRMEWLEKAAKTESDHACPHGVQFYDVVIDGKRYARAAWIYEAPRPSMRHVANRFGFWETSMSARSGTAMLVRFPLAGEHDRAKRGRRGVISQRRQFGVFFPPPYPPPRGGSKMQL